jgi:LPS O-antigen subunit length determinant protein (WzzB/FepE family)
MNEMKRPETPDGNDKPRMSLLVIVLGVLFGLCFISAIVTAVSHFG